MNRSYRSYPISVGRGFTLVEIMIVIIILGVLAATVLASIRSPARDTEATTFIKNLKTFVTIYDMEFQRTGDYPPDVLPSVVPPLPARLEQALNATNWTTPTPIGGQWDWDSGVFGFTAGISVFQPSRTAAEMAEIDEMIDDGDLNTGSFRSRAGGYIYIMAQ